MIIQRSCDICTYPLSYIANFTQQRAFPLPSHIMELNDASANSTLSETPGQVPNDGTGTVYRAIRSCQLTNPIARRHHSAR